jgi:diacylglycerol O-acyltransferase
MNGAETPRPTHPMSPVDAAWYHMDGPANPAIVTAVAVTRRPLDFRRLHAVLARRLLRFERFRQRVVERGLLPTPAWEDVPDFDIDAHLHRAALPSPGDESQLQALVGELAGLPLDASRPLWQVHVVDNVGAGGAMILRYHHCLADGTAMMAVGARLFDPPMPPLPHPAAAPEPLDLPAAVALAASEAGAVLSELIKWPDPRSPFKGDFGPRKSVAWSLPVPIEDIKAIGAPTGAKVNDVLVAALAGALRGYLRRRGVDVDHTTLRAMVPVDLRPPERIGELGNEFGLVILDLPVSAASASRRLVLAKAHMDEIKRSAQAPAMRLLLELLGRAPKAIEDLAGEIFGSKASVVLTNVAGPRETVRLAGVPVDRLLFCVPHPGDQLGMGLSIFSYRGMATLTLIADAGLVPDPQAITKAFHRELATMLRRRNRATAVRTSRGMAAAATTGC